MQDWTLQPVLPWSLWWGLAATTMLLICWPWRPRLAHHSLARGLGHSLLSMLLPFLLLCLLLNPGKLQFAQKPMSTVPIAQKPRVTLLLDTSASMSVHDEVGRQSRYDAALTALNTLVQELADHAQVEMAVFDDQLRTLAANGLPSTAQGPSTHLQAALMQILNREPSLLPQALVVLSDGIDHPSSQENSPGLDALAEQAAQRGIPIHTQAFGQPDLFQDLSLELMQEQTLTLRGHSTGWRLLVHHQGLAGEKVTLVHRGAGRGITTQSLVLDARPMQVVPFELTYDRAGEFLEDWHIEPVEGEATAQNNHVTGLVRVLDEPLRVLVLETQPSPEHRRLLRELESDAQLQVRSFLQLGPDRWLYRDWNRESSPPEAQFWSTLDESTAVQQWQEALALPWDILILGRELPAFFHPHTQPWLDHAIGREGKSLLFYRGLPDAWHQSFVTRLRSQDSPEAARITGVPIVASSPKPYGLGLVLTLTSPTQPQMDAETTASILASSGFWLPWIHQLAFTSQTRQDAQTILRTRQVVHDSQTPVLLDVSWPVVNDRPMPMQVAVQQLDAPDLPLQKFPVTIRQADWGWGEVDCGILSPGRYRVWLDDFPASNQHPLLLVVRAQDREWRDLKPQPATLAELSRLSGGITLTSPHPGNQLVNHWQQTQLEQQPPNHVFLPLRDQGWLLVILLALGCLVWTWLRREGLP